MKVLHFGTTSFGAFLKLGGNSEGTNYNFSDLIKKIENSVRVMRSVFINVEHASDQNSTEFYTFIYFLLKSGFNCVVQMSESELLKTSKKKFPEVCFQLINGSNKSNE